MFFVDQVILVTALLLLVGILSSKISLRIGLPVLVLFIAVGMLAGEEGPGGIEFDDITAAHAIATVALAVILFDGGLRTESASLRAAWAPALVLATVGVAITAGVTAVAAWAILEVTPLTAFLLGAIVASTDAAAVFSTLRSRGVRLPRRLAALLEVESGSNDPMAIFLTLAAIQLITSPDASPLDLVRLFALQMGVGAAAGLLVGFGSVRVVNAIRLDAAGLYPVLVGAFGLLAFGLAALLGGSGFLAVYLAGIVIGSSRLVFIRGTLLFFDALAWVGQIIMFTALGLLSTPSSVVAVAGDGLLIAAALAFVARPLATIPLLLPFRLSLREHVLVAWVGLKGAVPIVLAVFPLLFGAADAALIFNVVFFVVLTSAVFQGGTLPLLASGLRLQQPERPAAPIGLEITALRQVNAEIVDYTVTAHSAAANRRIADLAVPDGVVVAIIARANAVIPPQGATVVRPGDHLYAVVRHDVRDAADRLFQAGP